jgi:hypothetical protein
MNAVTTGTTVAELIDELQMLPSNAIVVMSKDAEGNRFSPFAEFSIGVYEPDTTYSGEFSTVEEGDDTETGEEPAEGLPAVCLWPTN